MDKKKIIITICIAVLLIAIVGIIAVVKQDDSEADNKGKQELSVEQSDDEEQGLKDAGALDASDESEASKDSGSTTNSNSINFSDIFTENNNGSTTVDNELNGEQGTQEEEQEEEDSEEIIPDTELEEGEDSEVKYGDIVRPQ